MRLDAKPGATKRQNSGLPRRLASFVPTATLSALATSPRPPLTVLHGPTGCGKTAAAAWLMRMGDNERADLAWVNIFADQMDREMFWDAVRRRLQLCGLADPDPATLPQTLARANRTLVLGIDGLELCAPEVDEQIAEFVASSDRIHVIATSRTTRLLMQRAILLDGAVVGPADLWFTEEEGHRVATNLGMKLSHSAVAELIGRVSGWPALLKLALLEGTVDADGAVVINQLSIDRFVHQGMQVLSPENRTSLCLLALPETLTTQLLHELLPASAVSALAEGLTELGLPQVNLLTKTPPAIREAQARALQLDNPTAYAEAHLRLARFFANSDPAAALDHALASGNHEQTYQLLQQHWSLLLTTAEGSLRAAIEMLPDSVIAADARLIVARAYTLNLFLDDRAWAAYEAGILVPSARGRCSGPRRLTVQQALTLRARQLPTQVQTMVESDDVGEIIRVSGWQPDVVQAVPGLLLSWANQLLLNSTGSKATFAFVETFDWASHTEQGQVRNEAAAGAALSQALLGDALAAQQWLEELDSNDALTPSADLMVRITRAVIERDTTGVPVSDLSGSQIPSDMAELAVVLLWLDASSLLASGRSRDAARLLEPYIAHHEPGESLLDSLLIGLRTEAWVAVGDLEVARKMLLAVDPSCVHYPAAWALVDVQSGEYQRTATLEAAPRMLPRDRITFTLLQAATALHYQNRAEAGDLFQTAMSVALGTGARRPFALLGDEAREELIAGDAQAHEFLAEPAPITSLFGAPPEGTRLSAREKEVLTVVATGAPFAAVARQLFVSPNTVKSQMRIIYRKLGVSGRQEAVRRAQELGFLPRDAAPEETGRPAPGDLHSQLLEQISRSVGDNGLNP